YQSPVQKSLETGRRAAPRIGMLPQIEQRRDVRVLHFSLRPQIHRTHASPAAIFSATPVAAYYERSNIREEGT
ncbi:hypothetical protein Pmar_PMAR025447, partial [Perkinsus marinus ATCC 50983]